MTLAVASSCAEMKQEETADLEELTALSSLLSAPQSLSVSVQCAQKLPKGTTGSHPPGHTQSEACLYLTWYKWLSILAPNKHGGTCFRLGL